MNEAGVTREDVIASFRWILGRLPESEDVIRHHMTIRSKQALRTVLLNSKEFLATNKFHRYDEKWVLAPVYGGVFEMWLDLHDLYVSYGCLMDDYEPVETAFIMANAVSGGTFLDIGANIGWHTLGLARIAGSEGRVYAFEPRQPTNRYLAKTIAHNGLADTVTLFGFGLWNDTVQLDLGWSAKGENPGNSYVVGEKAGLMTQGIELKRLDDVIESRVDFIKIDVEGAEPRVLQGAERLLSANKPIIMAELNPWQLQTVSKTSSADFIRQMAMYGYECRMLESGHKSIQIMDFPSEIDRDVINVVFIAPEH